MDSLIGCSLLDALSLVQDKYHKIVKIVKVSGNNSKFNNQNNPYVIKSYMDDDYITLFVTYY